ncbi:hypothetical protein AMTR_s00078p00150720 [Amborella trichopoda]|uniref:Extensin domain-containing protein n=1 Tax=Amborella trichopoda TaxID=13333 RepID=W1P8B6_AMBTC|nr:hypothetical protein AMTR_s00078p00150720 [Amborella trichopoda]
MKSFLSLLCLVLLAFVVASEAVIRVVPPSAPSRPVNPPPLLRRGPSFLHYAPPAPNKGSFLHYAPPAPIKRSFLHYAPPVPIKRSFLHYAPPAPIKRSFLHYGPPVPTDPLSKAKGVDAGHMGASGNKLTKASQHLGSV